MNQKDSCSRAAILIPLYKRDLTKAELFSIATTASVLAGWDIVFVGPERLAGWMAELKRGMSGRVELVLFDDFYFSSIAGYNRLLMSSCFYKRFESYEYILIAQTDALILRDDLSYWCDRGFSYIGAPWFEGFDVPSYPLRLLGVGNGGLSLRRVSDFLQVLSEIRYIPDGLTKNTGGIFLRIAKYIARNYVFAYNCHPLLPLVNEDFFWGGLVPLRFSSFAVPDPVEAASFAFEVEPRYLYELTGHKLPFGCHAWERYDRKFWVEKLELPEM